MKRSGTGSAAVCIALLLLGGCGREEPRILAELEVRQPGWDSLFVSVVYSGGTGGTAVAPQSTKVHVYDAGYDTLYAGPPGRIAVPDAELADQERLLVEACGTFDTGVICEQQALSASPKRVLVDEDLSFPEDSDFELGRYTFDFTVQRQVKGGDAWETIPARQDVTGYLLARSGDADGAAVKVPFLSRKGAFSLSDYEGFRDFQYGIKSQLYEQPEALVTFDVLAGVGGEPRQAASIRMWVHEMTQEEHEEKLASFLRQSAPRLLEQLGGHSSAYVYVDDWTFDELHDRYEADVELRWGNDFFRNYRLAGTLVVTEDGRVARFQRTGGNNRAEDMWAANLRREVINLAPLQIGPEDEEPNLAEAERRGEEDW